jgi:hypothetical protein
MPKDAYSDIQFPLGGIDRSDRYDMTPVNPSSIGASKTTNLGVNVRGFEAMTGRCRGGSRPGIVKYIAGRVGD